MALFLPGDSLPPPPVSGSDRQMCMPSLMETIDFPILLLAIYR
jgi:hypothetical protein